MIKTFTVAVDGARLVGDFAGNGHPIVFLHAGVADRRMWQAEIAALQGAYRVIAYDRRGFGETTASDAAFSHVDDLESVLDELGCKAAVLVGCSQGGRIAIDFALIHSDRVAGLVLVAPAVSGAASPPTYPPEIARHIEELEQAEEDEDIDRINTLEAWLWLDGPTSVEGRVDGKVRELFLSMNEVTLHHPEIGDERKMPPAMPRLGQLTMPVLTVWGDLDFEHIQRRSAQVAAGVPKGEGFLISGTAHFPNLEQPAAFTARLKQFLVAVLGPPVSP